MRQFVDVLMVLVLIATTFLWTGVCMLRQTSVAEFGTARELSDFVASRGYLLRHGKARDEPCFHFFFSDHALGDDEFAQLSCCADCGLTPKWKGIVRVNQIRSVMTVLNTTSIGGKTRIWGNVLLAGDEQLMDRVLQDIREHAPDKIR